ncbi:pirin family protein [Cellvibrio polysaccharolyticus]|uniref:Pirin family protein n=1 Tax=Cellvibrio polysaccharolyticus TaxID=2082724 RepID=A0A928V281_9GAMM|nr:pirin family protein [Cellvibrio polysaccharolyticus]MBE8715611.1 pirin family protein [Cellvibrio polysaccharolyticus]
MITVRRSEERGSGHFDWLNSRHTFSFGSYYDTRFMGFSALRVINDDEVVPGAGFPTHGHSDMEIISYVLEGEIAHRDSEGNIARLPAGEFQLMSAGRGITHSEFNASVTAPLKFLQIWIQPNVYGQTPGYQQKDFGENKGLTLVISPDGEAGSLTIKQDARLYQLLLEGKESVELPVASERRAYIHVIEGELHLGNHRLQPGDGVAIEDEKDVLTLMANNSAVKALVFDLP